MAEARRFVFTPAWMRRLGVTKENLQEQMLAMDAAAQLPSLASEIDMTDAAEMQLRLQAERQDAYCTANEAGADWNAFFEALIKFMQALMPFIIKARKAQPQAA